MTGREANTSANQTSEVQQSYMQHTIINNTYTQTLNVWYIYLHLVNFLVNVGKYTIH